MENQPKRPTPTEAAELIFTYLERRGWGRGKTMVQEADIASIINGTFLEQELEQPCAEDFVVIASGEPFRFRRSDARGGAIWVYCWHKHQKSWVSSRQVSDADAQRAFLTALPVEQAKHYEGGVPFLQNNQLTGNPSSAPA